MPKPVIKMVIPLTEAPGESTGPRAADLLVVVDEPWFAVGGLAERLEASVVEVMQKKKKGEKDVKWPEFGPDPIMSGSGWRDSDLELILSPPHFPIGHTFDTDTSEPKFVASSFVLPVPTFKEHPDISWYFAKMRFRRRLIKEGHVQGQEVANDPDLLVSAYTDAQWVQFLPDASSYSFSLAESTPGEASPRLSLEDVAVKVSEDNDGVIELCLRERHGVSVQADWVDCGSDTEVLDPYLWIVLTRVITDMNGRDAEKYACLFEWKQDEHGRVSWDRLDGRTDPCGPEARYRARILEVHQRNVTSGPMPKAWGRVFPTSPDEDAWARIVRISRPIDSVP